MNKIRIVVNRKSAYCAAAMPYRILINDVEHGKLWNGKSMVLEVPNEKMTLTVSMVGNGFNLHKIKKQVVLFPEHCKTGQIRCDIITKMNMLGVFTSGLFQAVGRLNVEVSYD